MTYTRHTACSPPHRPCSRRNLDPPLPLREKKEKECGEKIIDDVFEDNPWRCVTQQLINDSVTLLTFSTFQLGTHSIRDVVGGVTLEAVGGARAEFAVVCARLTAPLLGVVEGLRTGVQTLACIQVTLHSKLIWRKCSVSVNLAPTSSWLLLCLL